MAPAPLVGELVVVVMTGVVPDGDGLSEEDEPEEEDDGVVTAGDVPVLGVVVDAVDTTVMPSFMPLWQWPEVGHMKYIGPAELRVMVVCPPL